MVLYSSWFCHSSGLNINVSSFIVICETRIAFTIKGPISLELQRNRSHIFDNLSIVFLKNLWLERKKLNVTKKQR